MGGNESRHDSIRSEFKADDGDFEVLNTGSDDLIEKTADYIKSVENDNYGRFKLMQYRVSKRQFAVIERITSEFRDFEEYCKEVDKRLKFDAPQLVRWIRSYKQCDKQYCSSFFKLYISIDYIPHSLKDQLESRKSRQTHCGEKEIFNMIDSVLSALIFLNSNGIQHKYIQPKTILYDQANHSYQITDIQFLNGGISEYQSFLFGVNSTQPCYLSPQLLKALNHRQQIPEHSISKSDVFSLGLSALEMATMKSVQSIYDFLDFQINEDNLNFLLSEIQTIYSDNLLSVLMKMLTIQEIQRPDFDDLAYILKDMSAKPQFIESTQSMRASVISEEFNKSSRLNKKSTQNDRPSSCSTLRNKNNNGNHQNSMLSQQNIQNNNKSKLNGQNLIPSSTFMKNSSMYKDGLNEFEDDKQNTQNALNGSIKISYQSPLKVNKNNIQQHQIHSTQPEIPILQPIFTKKQEDLYSPIPITSNQQLGELLSANLASPNNLKQASAKKQEDHQINQYHVNSTINQQINTQQNSSPNRERQMSPQKNNIQFDQQKQTYDKLRSQSQHQNYQSFIDPVEQEYEEFKAKQRQLYLQQKHSIINNEKQSYLQEKRNWEFQQQQYIQDSKRHEDLQQTYIESQQQTLPFYRDDSRKYLVSQQSLKSGAREHQNNLPTYKQNFYISQNKSPTKSALINRSPQKMYYGKIGSQNISTPKNIKIDQQAFRQETSGGRNQSFRSPPSIMYKSPKLHFQDQQRFYNDENVINYNIKNIERSLSKNNNDNILQYEYSTNNGINNSQFENSISQNRLDMSMLSNYEIQDIHIQSYKRNENNIQNTLNMLEERIDQIDKSLSNIKKPLRSSSNNGFQFHQNNLILSPNSNKKVTFQQRSKFQKGNSSSKTNQYNHNYDNTPYSTPFIQGNNYNNPYQFKF